MARNSLGHHQLPSACQVDQELPHLAVQVVSCFLRSDQKIWHVPKVIAMLSMEFPL
eukprot:c32394_g1_i1 orf=175-342(+)